MIDTLLLAGGDNSARRAVKYDGIFVDADSAGNTIRENLLRDNAEHDCHDDSTGTGTGGTANTWSDNDGETANRTGICPGAVVPASAAKAAPAPALRPRQALAGRGPRHLEEAI